MNETIIPSNDGQVVEAATKASYEELVAKLIRLLSDDLQKQIINGGDVNMLRKIAGKIAEEVEEYIEFKEGVQAIDEFDWRKYADCE